jgi:hypothetical protein
LGLLAWYLCFLKVEHKARRLGSRHADLHDLVSGALVIAQNVIPVIGHALEDRNLADTALAALAIVHRVDAFLYQHLQNALVGRTIKVRPERCSTTSIWLSAVIASPAWPTRHRNVRRPF